MPTKTKTKPQPATTAVLEANDALLPCYCDVCGFPVSTARECVVCGRWGCGRDMCGRVCIDCDEALGESEVGAW